jgi:uncharacterized glyoxalase superfamily protein PhnB
MSPTETPQLSGVYLFVRNRAASVAFYRRIGLTVEEVGDTFARAELPNGQSIEFGTAELTRTYDPGWTEPSGAATNALNFTVASREAVDAMYADLTSAGYRGHLAPIDAFWGARYAIVDDPDGNVVGFHGR